MPKRIPFERQTNGASMHQIALTRIVNKAHIIERIADSVRLRSMRLETRSPAIAADLADFADEIAILADGIKSLAHTALREGEEFLIFRNEMVEEVKRAKSATKP